MVPDRPVVVLDMKDWIDLSKPTLADHLKSLQILASKGARFPVSSTVLDELIGGSTIRQRRDITETIRVLGGFTFVHDPNVVWIHEVESALDKFVGRDEMSALPLDPIRYVTDVFGFFGESAPKVSVMRGNQDVTEAFFREHPDRANIVKEALQRLPFELAGAMLTSSPRSGVWSALLANKLAPQYEQAIEHYRKMNEHVRRLFLRRLTSVIVMAAIKDLDVLVASCMARGMTVPDVLGIERDSYGNTIMNVMPSFDAFVALSMQLIKEGREITTNDLQDMRHLATTVPYADFVMTDKRMMRLFELSGLRQKARARVLYSLDELSVELEKTGRRQPDPARHSNQVR